MRTAIPLRMGLLGPGWPDTSRVGFDVPALVNRIQLRNPPFPIALGCAGQGNFWLVTISWRVPHRDEPTRLVDVASYVTVAPSATPERVLLEIEDRIRGAFVHEFQECFHIDGVRVRDPHPRPVMSGPISYTATKPEGV